MRLPDYLADPALRDFAAVEDGALRALVRRGYEGMLAALTERGAGGGETVAGGRAAHPVVTLPGGERVVVRRYLRGGLVRHFVRERYVAGHRAWEELRAMERARAAGVLVPVALAASELRRGVGYEATLATRWVEGGRELAGWLREAAEAERLGALEAAGGAVGRMHAGGLAHPDLNLRNFLVAPAGLHLLDFDRARVQEDSVGAARRARDLRRLARSARKLAAPIGAPEWVAFRRGYGAAWPAGLFLP